MFLCHFYKAITDTDDFSELPASTRLLYYELGMQANEKGKVIAPRTLMRTTETSLKTIEGATVTAEGTIVDSMGNVLGKLEDVEVQADGTKTGILDLNGTPIEIKTNANSVISDLTSIMDSIFKIPSSRTITVDAVSSAGYSGSGRSATGRSLIPDVEVPEVPQTYGIEAAAARVSAYDYSAPTILSSRTINSGYSTVGSPTPRNIERLTRRNSTSSQDSTEILLRQMIELLAKNSEPIIEVPVNLDGRQIAKASAKYMNSEIDNLNLRKNRLGGAF